MKHSNLSGSAPAPFGVALVREETDPGERLVWSLASTENDPIFLGGGKQREEKALPTSVNKAKATLFLPFFCFFDCINNRFCFSGRTVCCELRVRRDRWLWALHVLCFCLHLTMCILSLNAGSGDMSVKIVRISASWESVADYGYTVVDAKSQFVSIDVVTAAFFGLSAVMHGLWVFLGPWTFFLWRQIDNCLVATRWIEYSLSASLMAMAIAITVGLREQNVLSAIFFLHFITMLCGLLCEMMSRPARDREKCGYNMEKWEGDPDKPVPSSTAANASTMDVGAKVAPLDNGALTYAEQWRRYRLGRWRSYVWRMAPHVAGYFPFIAAWVIIVDFFLLSVDDICENLRNQMPDFVIPVVFGSVGIFSCFAVVQAWYQFQAPKHYWKTEATAKLYLGGLLYVNVLTQASFNEALAADGATDWAFNYTEACLPPSPPMAPPALPASG